jgi:hypothetical protein
MTLAEKAKEEHQRKYPTYQYKPQLNRMKLIRRPNSSSKRELKVNSRVVDKVLAEKRVDPVDELTNDVNARLKLDGGRPSTTRTDRKNAHLRNPKLTRKPKPVIVPSVDPVPSLEIDSAPSSTDSSFESIQDALGPWNVEPAVVSVRLSRSSSLPLVSDVAFHSLPLFPTYRPKTMITAPSREPILTWLKTSTTLPPPTSVVTTRAPTRRLPLSSHQLTGLPTLHMQAYRHPTPLVGLAA